MVGEQRKRRQRAGAYDADRMSERVDVIVVGAGQAGLAASYELTGRGIDHLVLDRARIGGSWLDRWDSFCLVTPNWTVRLPGGAYDGTDPDGFMPRDEIASLLERYAASFGAPVRTNVDVDAIRRVDDGFTVSTSAGRFAARSVVVATGTYTRPHRPAGADALPPGLAQLGVGDYRNPDALPPGDVLVVGSGQSGCQIAEELLRSGREAVVACGRAPWLYRRFSGRDMVWWAVETGFLDVPVGALPSEDARLFANIQGSGRDGGHDLNTRVLRELGATLAGHFVGVDDGRAVFADDLGDSVAWGDARHREFMGLVERCVADRGLEYDPPPPPPRFDATAPASVALDRFGSVLFAGGFRPAYADRVHVPGAFDPLGFPRHRDGQSVVAPGLFFLGTHFLRTRKSSLLLGVGEDAAIVADAIAARR
jgi:putative flavoprotein involved in K+ transport